MVPVSSQWRCRICRFERYHQVSVLRKDGSRYETSFYACSACSVMFLNPANFNADNRPGRRRCWSSRPDRGETNRSG
jgi:hypothetical protein